MSSPAELDPAVPDLRAPALLIAALLTRPGEQNAELSPEHEEILAAVGGFPGGSLHPRLAEVRRLVGETLVDIVLERGERQGRAWLAPAVSVVVHPLAEARARLFGVPTPLLLDALVRLNDVGPRPRYEPAVPIALDPGALAAVLATRDAARARLGDETQAAALRSIAGGLREHWRVATRWDPAEGAVAGRVLEVLDTDVGYWLVIPDGPTVELWPTTPTAVFRSLAQLFPLTHELAMGS